MDDLVQVMVRGNAAPETYEDFSAMLESSLAAVRKTRYVLSVHTDNMRLWQYVTAFGTEYGKQVLYGVHLLPVGLAVFFLTADSAKSFDMGEPCFLPRPPTIFLF